LVSSLVAAPAAAEDADVQVIEVEASEDGDDGDEDAETSVEPSAGQLEEVVVTGSRRKQTLADSPVATEVITREQVERSGAVNLAELLEEHPGIRIVRTPQAGATIQMQGLESKYVLVLIDNQRTVGRVQSQNDLSRIAAEDIERIEIVKGPSSALYGSDAIGGVVHIITKRSRKPFEARAIAEYGQRNTVELGGHVGWSTPYLRGRVMAGWRLGDAYDLDPSTEATNGNSYSAVHGGIRLSYDPIPARYDGDTLVKPAPYTITASSAYTIRNENGVDQLDRQVFDREQLVEIFDGSVDSIMRLSPDAKLRLLGAFTLYRFQRLSDRRGVDEYEYEDTIERRPSLLIQHDQRLFEDHTFTLGSEMFHQRLESQLRLGDEPGTRTGIAFFLQDQWDASLVPRLSVVPGLRVDVDSQFGVYPSPKLTLRYDPHRMVVLRGSYGWGFRAPNFEELLLSFINPSVGYEVRGNLDLDPERSRAVNVGAELRPHDRFWASLNFFRNDIDDLIQTESVPGPRTTFQYVNIARANTMGLEAMAAATPVKGLRLEAGYTLTHTEDEELDRPLENVALHRGTWRGHYHFKYWPAWGWHLQLRGQVVGQRPFYSADADGDGVEERTDADPYVTIDARAAFDFLHDHVSAFVGVDNMSNTGDTETLPIAPRRFYGGVQGRY
jgi:outer membrane receptor for ferrienterochelin and colicins